MNASQERLIIRELNLQPYDTIWQQMRDFTEQRDETTDDEIWFVEHPSVFTQGQAGKEEHLLIHSQIPVIKTDRGGQITYHGPGQLIAYLLIDIRRKTFHVRTLVTAIERAVQSSLLAYQLVSDLRPDAPGVYINNQKICSLGLKIRKGCSYHGLALNVDMDLTPFLQINPCGYAGLEMTQLKQFCPDIQLNEVKQLLMGELVAQLGYHSVVYL